MTVAAALLAYAVGAGTMGPGLLGRAGWTVRAPLLAVVTYLAAAWSVVAALALAGLTLAVHATALGGGLSHLIGACVLRIRDTYAAPGGATAAGFGLALATALVVLATPVIPAPALAVSATDTVQRIHRLLSPAEPLSRVRRQLLRAGAAVLALTPVLLALTRPWWRSPWDGYRAPSQGRGVAHVMPGRRTDYIY